MLAVQKYVLIDGTKLADAHIDGIRRYLEELLKSLDVQIARQRPDWSIRVTIDSQNSFPLHDVVEALHRSDEGTPLTLLERRLNALRQPAPKWKQKLIRLRAKIARSAMKRFPQWRQTPSQCGLIHLPLPSTYGLYAQHPTPMLVTVHDLSHLVCPEFQTPLNIATLANGLAGAIHRDASFVADSESTKREMIELLGVPSQQTQVIHLACDRNRFQPESDPRVIQRVREKYRLPNQPFVLTLCRLEPRKNLKSVVRACQQLFQTRPDLPFHLVIGGGGGWGNQAEELAKLASDRIHLTGAIEEADLAALYSSAAAFTCMSFYEGFGLPILEAMSCGCPVIHSNTSAMPEVAGGAGLSASPTDIPQIARHLEAILRDPALSERLKSAGLAQANHFSWTRAANEILERYESLLSPALNAEQRIPRRVVA